MASFQDAFHKGLEAHDSADRAKKEIFSVFEDCAKQVSAASRGVILLSRASASRVREDAGATATILGALGPRESYQTLVARLVSEPNSKGEELCEYKLSFHGYPVSIVYADVDEYCHDQSGLERALVHLLGHPSTGGKLRRLMDLHAKKQGGGASSPPPGGQDVKAE